MRRVTQLHDAVDYLARAAVPEESERERRKSQLYSALNAAFPSVHSFRVAVDVMISGALRRAAQMVILGQNVLAVGEIHAVLERYALARLPLDLGSNNDSRKVIQDLLARKTLGEIAEIFNEIGRWDKDDLQFIRRLCRLRNGIAHRNYVLLKQIVGSQTSGSESDVDRALDKQDALPYLIRAMELIIIATRFKRKSSKRTK